MTQVSSFILARQTYGGDEFFKNAGCDAMTKPIGFQETVICFFSQNQGLQMQDPWESK